MTFERYLKVIQQSVAETGYDSFSPSLCIANDAAEMNVLNTELSVEDDEVVAKEWASHFTLPNRTLFLAYRQGGRTVTVVEIIGSEVTQKHFIKVESFTEE